MTTINSNEGQRAIREVTYATCKSCGARVRLDDGRPAQVCCGDFRAE